MQKATTVSQEQITNLEKAFIKERNVVEFIQTLETARPIFDEFILAFTSDIPVGKDIQNLTFTVKTKGLKENTIAFINSLLKSTYVVEPTQIELLVDSKDSTKWNLTFAGNLYIQSGK